MERIAVGMAGAMAGAIAEGIGRRGSQAKPSQFMYPAVAYHLTVGGCRDRRTPLAVGCKSLIRRWLR